MRRRRNFASGFNPLSLFANGESGFILDTSDYSYLFQDSYGTTAVTAVDQAVGLVLDKSQGLVIQSELITDSSFDNTSAWSKSAASVVVSGGSATWTSAASGVYVADLTAFIPVAGAWYKVELVISSITGGALRIGNEVGTVLSSDFSTSGTKTFYTNIPTTSTLRLRSVGTTTASVSSFSVKRFLGNHAYQSTSGSRPLLRSSNFIDFDGSDDRLSVGIGGGSTTGFFFCSGIYVDSAALTHTIFSDTGTNTGYRIRINSSNQIEFSAGNGSSYITATTTETVSAAGKYVVTAWHDGSSLKVQLDDGAIASASIATASAGSAGLTLGRDNAAASNFLNGRICHPIYVKNASVSSAQINGTKALIRAKAGL